MESGKAISRDDISGCGNSEQHTRGYLLAENRAVWTFYVLALLVSISTWLIGIRAPLRVDETGTYWQIGAGFAGIWPRQFISLSFPTYSYILWLSTKLIGSSELALRIPSVVAMLGAAYLFYLAARELIGQEFAIIATIIFSLNPFIIFEAIDIRPYGFAVLFTNAAILVLLRLRKSQSNWLAVLFGLLAAVIVSLHYLFAAILPAFFLCLIAFKVHDRKALLRQCGVALAAFTLAFVPMVPGLQYLFRTASSHVCAPNPTLGDLFVTFIPVWLVPAAALTALFAVATTRSIPRVHLGRWRILLCGSLAVIPTLILYGVTVTTSLNVFSATYHRLSAIPGMSLLLAMALYRFRSSSVRIVFCSAYAVITLGSCLWNPVIKQHSYSWKYALQIVQENTQADNAPVVMCSNHIESNYTTMPVGSAKTSLYFAPLSYYRLTAPVIPLPETLNDETARVFLPFLKESEQKHERFLAIGHSYSYKTLDWIIENASGAYTVRTLGVYDEVKVLEFVPRDSPANRER